MYSSSENEHVKNMLEKYVIAKRYYYDMLFDLEAIVRERKVQFENELTEYDRLELTAFFNSFFYHIKKPKHKFRIYIVCGIKYVSLAYIDVPSEIAERIQHDIDEILSGGEPIESKNIPNGFSGTMYIFKHSKIIYRKSFNALMVSFLLNALKDENLIDESLRLHWKNTF